MRRAPQRLRVESAALPALFATLSLGMPLFSLQAAELQIQSPCSALLDDADPLEQEWDVNPASTADAKLQTLLEDSVESRKESLTKGIPLLKQRGIEAMLVPFAEGEEGKPYFGLGLFPDERSQDPLMRALGKLDSQWRRRGKELPEIIIKEQAYSPSSSGSYQPGNHRITLAPTVFAEYLLTGQFPQTLKHELRHASFRTFLDSRERKNVRFLSAALNSETALDTAKFGETYLKRLSFEETYNHPMDLKSRFLMLESAWKKNVEGATLEELEGAWIAFERKLKGTPAILQGAQSEVESALTALEKSGKAALQFTDRRNRVTFSYLNTQGNLSSLDLRCQGCGWGNFFPREVATQQIRKALESEQTYLLVLLEMQKRLEPNLKRISNLLEQGIAENHFSQSTRIEVDVLFKSSRAALREEVRVITELFQSGQFLPTGRNRPSSAAAR